MKNQLAYDVRQNYKPTYTYSIEKEGELFEFNSYTALVREVREWDDVAEKIDEFESELEDKWPVDSDDERDMWLMDNIDEILFEAGYSLEKSLN